MVPASGRCGEGSVVPAVLSNRRSRGAVLGDAGALDLRCGFRRGGRRRDRGSGLCDSGCRRWCRRSGRGVTAWPMRPARLSLRAVGLGVRGRRSSGRIGIAGFGCGRGRRGLAGQRSGGGDGGRRDRERRRRIVGCGRRGSRRRRRAVDGDGDGNGVGRHDGRCILRWRGLIGCRGIVAGRCLVVVSSDFAGLSVASDFDLAARVVVGLGVASVLASALASSRGLAAASRSSASRCARPCRMPPCPMRRRCRARGCRMRPAHRRSGAGRARLARRARLSLLLAAVLLSTSAAKLSFPADWLGIPAARTSPARSEKTRLPILLT